MNNTLVLLSGGLDSSVLLAYTKAKHALSICYGQWHPKEIEAAKAICVHYNVEHTIIKLPIWTSLKDDIPEGPYIGNDVPSTYVPFRNGVFAAVAASIAYEKGLDNVALAIHGMEGGDAAYPDCTPEFAFRIGQAVYSGTKGKVDVIAPFVTKTKAEIVQIGYGLKVPFEKTWSCYKGGEKPCNVCATCIERREAFLVNGLDPEHPYLGK
jgi:7-cyano-7-deazaguanine synthase